jgi:hypothetical protein
MDRAPMNLVGLTNQRSSWFAPAIAVFLSVLAAAAVLAYYFAPGQPGLGGELPDPTDATRPVSLTIGATRFRIPANYILLTSARRGGPMTEIRLAAMLPRLQGYSIALAKDFASSAPESPIVNVAIRSGRVPLSEAERLERIYRLQVENTEGAKQADGLTRFKFREDSGYRGQELFTGTIAGQPIVILCDRETPDTASPNCVRDIPFGPGLALSFRFRRASLAQWRDIDAGVKKLVASFVEKN